MPQFECQECGQLTRAFEHRSFQMECPECGEQTVWAPAFEGEGVDL